MSNLVRRDARRGLARYLSKLPATHNLQSVSATTLRSGRKTPMPNRTNAMLAALLVSAMMIPAPAEAQQGRAAPAAAPVAAACSDGQGPTSAFFCAPLVNNESVRACATNAKGAALTQCQQAAAASFCRTRSYSAAAAYQVTPSGNLSEVLCRAPIVAAAAQAGAAAGSATPAAAPAAPVQMNSVYATRVESGANPTLTLSPFGPQMTGTYTVTQDEAFFDSIYQSGGGTITEGRIEGTLNGNVFTGYWYENQGRTAVQRECDPARGSERIFGRFTLTFSADRKSFTGLHSTCDGAPEDAYFASWSGTLTGQVAAVATSQASPSGSATATAQTASSGKRNKNGKAPKSETVADRLAREAADEAERATGDKVRRGVRDVIEGKLPF
jgi:hypothetical protein